MKRVFFALVSLAALTGTAAAADLPPRPAPAPYYKAPVAVPVYNWTGFYIGINGGGGFGRSQWDTTGGFNTSGGLVGGTVGYNYQFGQAVVGVEGDIDWADINGTTNTACPLGCKTSDHWLVDRARPARLRGRPLHALRHRRRRVRRHQRLDAGLRRRQPQPMPAGPSARASNSRSPATGPPRPSISTSTSASSIAASRAVPPYRQRVVHDQHRSRRRQLSVLIAAATA